MSWMAEVTKILFHHFSTP
uniref:Uncharacterized protein n=1 Tax=Anguilla anguilla TaxID=7936 RepID=A0A0E9P6H9_ANGAN